MLRFLGLIAVAGAFPSVEYRFNFTATRNPGAMMQLQEIRLYDNVGLVDLVMAGATAGNPDGTSPKAHPVGNVIDSDVKSCDCLYSGPGFVEDLIFCSECKVYVKGNKWLDFNTQVPCVDDSTSDCNTDQSPYYAIVDIRLRSPIDVVAYELISANDNHKRDPTAWSISAKLLGSNEWSVLDERDASTIEAPFTRYTSYGKINLAAPPPPSPPPSPPAPPHPPPSPPAPPMTPPAPSPPPSVPPPPSMPPPPSPPPPRPSPPSPPLPPSPPHPPYPPPPPDRPPFLASPQPSPPPPAIPPPPAPPAAPPVPPSHPPDSLDLDGENLSIMGGDDNDECGAVCIAFLVIGSICLVGALFIGYYLFKSRQVASVAAQKQVELKTDVVAPVKEDIESATPAVAAAPTSSMVDGSDGTAQAKDVPTYTQAASNLGVAAVTTAAIAEDEPDEAEETETAQVVGVSVMTTPEAEPTPEEEPEAAVVESITAAPSAAAVEGQEPEPADDAYEPKDDPYEPKDDPYEPKEDPYEPKEDPYEPENDPYDDASAANAAAVAATASAAAASAAAASAAAAPSAEEGREGEEGEEGEEESDEALYRRVAWIKYYVQHGDLDKARDLGWNGDTTFLELDEGATPPEEQQDADPAGNATVLTQTSMHRI